MRQMLTFICEAISAEVYWAENIPSHGIPKGWIADVGLAGMFASALAGDEETAKRLAVVLARDLCLAQKVDLPVCLDDPQWISELTTAVSDTEAPRQRGDRTMSSLPKGLVG